MAAGKTPRRPARETMNATQLLKSFFFILILGLLVLMGLHNSGTVSFSLPPLLQDQIRQPAALMYLGFFAVGLVTGMIATLGRGKASGSGKGG